MSIVIPGGTAKQMAIQATTESVKIGVHIAIGAATGAVTLNPMAVVAVAADVAGLMWKAGAYLHHKSNLQSQLAVCLKEYCEAGYLTCAMDGQGKPTSWRTTPLLQDAKILLQVYPDIKQYISDMSVSPVEM